MFFWENTEKEEEVYVFINGKKSPSLEPERSAHPPDALGNGSFFASGRGRGLGQDSGAAAHELLDIVLAQEALREAQLDSAHGIEARKVLGREGDSKAP